MLADGKSMTVTGRRHGVEYVGIISKQLLLGLDFLHGQGIIHSGMFILVCDLEILNQLAHRLTTREYHVFNCQFSYC